MASNSPQLYEELWHQLSRDEQNAFYRAAEDNEWNREINIAVIEYAVPLEIRRRADEVGSPHKQSLLSSHTGWASRYTELCRLGLL